MSEISETRDHNDQWEISREVLDQLLTGPVNLTSEGDKVKLVAAGQLRLNRLSTAIAMLKQKTGDRKAVDPFVQPDGNAWVIVSDMLSKIGLLPVALEVSSQPISIIAMNYREQPISEYTKEPLYFGLDFDFWRCKRQIELKAISYAP